MYPFIRQRCSAISKNCFNPLSCPPKEGLEIPFEGFLMPLNRRVTVLESGRKGFVWGLEIAIGVQALPNATYGSHVKIWAAPVGMFGLCLMGTPISR